MELKDMTDLIVIYDAYKELDKLTDALTGGDLPLQGSVMERLSVIETLIARNSALYMRDHNDPSFDLYESEHGGVLNDTELSPEQRAFRLLGICNEA